jgi:hypothetical protein
MSFYVVYDKNDGTILLTYSKYLLGNDEPVACTEDEVLALAAEEFGSDAKLGFAQVPDDFDPRARNQRLSVDQNTGAIEVKPSPTRPRSKSRKKKR